ncbi:MAG: hypothetical protein QXL63_02705 [Candidatus Micrarchaeaceae archaeon]
MVIALKCVDGIVVASDTGMSLRSDADPSSYVSVYLKKIYPADKYILALAGTVWINQKIKKLADDVFGDAPEISESMFEQFLSGIADIIKKDIELRSSSGIQSIDAVKEDISIEIILAYVDSNGKNAIWVADHYLRGRHAEEKFVVLAENDLAYAALKEYEDVDLTMKEGKLVVLKAIKDTMRLSPTFLAEPIDIYTISNQSRKITEVGDEELKRLTTAYERLRNGNVRLLQDTVAEAYLSGALRKEETKKSKNKIKE